MFVALNIGEKYRSDSMNVFHLGLILNFFDQLDIILRLDAGLLR